MSVVTTTLQLVDGGDPCGAERRLPFALDELCKLAQARMAEND